MILIADEYKIAPTSVRRGGNLGDSLQYGALKIELQHHAQCTSEAWVHHHREVEREHSAGFQQLLERRKRSTFAGLDVAIIFAVIGAIVGEFIGAPSGLGSLIVQRQYSMNVAGVFSAIVFLTITGFVLHWLVKLAARRAAFWAPADQLQH